MRACFVNERPWREAVVPGTSVLNPCSLATQRLVVDALRHWRAGLGADGFVVKSGGGIIRGHLGRSMLLAGTRRFVHTPRFFLLKAVLTRPSRRFKPLTTANVWTYTSRVYTPQLSVSQVERIKRTRTNENERERTRTNERTNGRPQLSTGYSMIKHSRTN